MELLASMILTPIMGCFTPDYVNGCIKAGVQGSDDASSGGGGGSDGAGSDGAGEHHQEQQPGQNHQAFDSGDLAAACSNSIDMCSSDLEEDGDDRERLQILCIGYHYLKNQKLNCPGSNLLFRMRLPLEFKFINPMPAPWKSATQHYRQRWYWVRHTTREIKSSSM